MNFKALIESDKLPKHVAIIMDGNGRWAKGRGLRRVSGHKNGVKAVRDSVEGAAEIGVKYLTLYAFSTENWNRPKTEVDALMKLLISTLKKELKTLMDNNIRLQAIGELENLPKSGQRELQEVIDATKDNKHMQLNLALSYGSRTEMVQATKRIAQAVLDKKLSIEDINHDSFAQHLYTADMPDPELLIRTSGERRISNYLLWQIAYAELYFTPVLWPDFRRENLFEAIYDFQNRERRFGKTSEQL